MLINQDNGLLISLCLFKWPGIGVNLKDCFQYIKVWTVQWYSIQLILVKYNFKVILIDQDWFG